MRTISLNQATADMQSFINYTLSSKEEINIATDNGAVVMLPQEEYESMLETLRLISDKKSLKALLESHAIRDDGKEPKAYSISEVFGDL
jgi:PHD/YefM family antitoxin component YafN of YafNO toxin-antitoxin module